MTRKGHLVLSRKAGQKIIVGDRDVEITIISIDRGVVRMSFSSDTTTAINREEIFLSKQQAKDGKS